MSAERAVAYKRKRRRKSPLPRITFLAILLISIALLVLLIGWLVNEIQGLFDHSDGDRKQDPVYLQGQALLEEFTEGKTLTVTAGKMSVSLSAHKAGAPVNQDELADFMKEKSGDKKLFSQFKRLLSRNKIPFSVYNEEYVKEELEDLARQLNDGADAGYEIREDGVLFLRGRNYVSFDIEAALGQIKEAFAKFSEGPVVLETTESPMQMPDLNKIREKIYIAPEDAYFHVDENKNTHLIKEVVGRDLELSAITAAYQQNDWTEKFFPFVELPPAETEESLFARYFQDELAVMETRYSPADRNRTTNVILSAEAINGTIVMPGETFSFNRVVGERTAERGYKEAKIYTSLGVEPGLGGGICQVSSTIYVAALKAELHQVTRYAHGFTVTYVDLGLDATIAWPTLDYVFRNTKPDPVRLDITCENGKLTVKIMGTKTGDERDITFVTNVLETIEPEILETLDETKEPGYYELTSKGSRGYVTETFKIAKVNGQVVEKVKINTSRYSPYRGTAIVGPPLETEPVTTSPDGNPDNTPPETAQ